MQSFLLWSGFSREHPPGYTKRNSRLKPPRANHNQALRLRASAVNHMFGIAISLLRFQPSLADFIPVQAEPLQRDDGQG